MLTINKDLMTSQEAARMASSWTARLPGRLLRRSRSAPPTEPQLATVYRASVEQCFVLPDFNEELPLYVLDLGGTILVLFGQWLFDPNVTVLSDQICKSWNWRESFFSAFTIRWSETTGTVFELKVENESYVRAQYLPSNIKFTTLKECQAVRGQLRTLASDLQKAGMIEP
jgi:hypothetical protein